MLKSHIKMTKSKPRDCTPQMSPPSVYLLTAHKNNNMTFGNGETPNFNKRSTFLFNQQQTFDGVSHMDQSVLAGGVAGELQSRR